jgi:hypothetical protein
MTKEERNARKRARYALHREQECKKKREWYAANAEKVRGYWRDWAIKKGRRGGERQAWSRWTPDRVAKLHQMRAHGRTYAECAVILNSTAEACERAADRHGLPKRRINKNREPLLARHSTIGRETPAQSAMWTKLLRAQ